MGQYNWIIVSSEFPPQPGGIGNHAFNLAEALTIAGQKVAVVTNSRSPADWHSESAFDATLSFDVIRTPRYSFLPLHYLKRLFQVFTAIGRSKGATILASGKFSIWVVAFAGLFFPGSRSFAVVHGSELNPKNPVLRAWMKLSLRSMTGLIAVSGFTRRLVQKLDADLRPVVVLNGFNVRQQEVALPAQPLKGTPALITVGNITQRKGQQNIIKALPGICRQWPEVHYHLVGIPSEMTQLTRLAASLGVENRLTFHGVVENRDLYSLLQGADIFMILPEQLPNGDVEGFGIAILEAGYFGVPAIGGSDSGTAEAIKDGFSGRVVDPRNEEAILAAIEDIVAHREAYRRNAKSWSANFQWSKVVMQYLNICTKNSVQAIKANP